MRLGPAHRTLALALLAAGVACAGIGTVGRPGQVDAIDPDAEAMAIALAANGAGLHLARLALQRASHPMVRELACARISEYELAVDWLGELAYRADIPRVQSAHVAELDDQMVATLAQLRPLWGMGFDRAWLRNSAGLGVWLAGRLDPTAIAAIRDPVLRAGLEEMVLAVQTQAGELGVLEEYLVGFHD
jgi:predicted outer membrane protein